MASAPQSLYFLVTLCLIYYAANGGEARFYEILESCPFKDVLFHKLNSSFLALWQMFSEKEKVSAGLVE